jgi:hypothetical protein
VAALKTIPVEQQQNETTKKKNGIETMEIIMKAYIVAAVLGPSLTAAAVAPASAGDFATDYFMTMSLRGN